MRQQAGGSIGAMIEANLFEHGGDTILAQTSKLKIRISPVLYVAAIVCAFYVEWLAGALYALVALMWLVPDRRIERALGEH